MINPNFLVGASVSLREQVLGLVWSLWTEMGVPGWLRRHQDWAIDPEPLILFTVLVGESDQRLQDECINWCARNSRSVSTARLRHLLRASSPAVHAHWGPFAATVNALGAAGWPNATEPLSAKRSSKEGLDDFSRAAMISLRLRTTFGVSARSEILLYFIAHPDARVSASDLAEVVHYSKRNVERELAALRKAGMLGVEQHGNRHDHFVRQPESLLLFAAPRPGYFPRWDAIFSVLDLLLAYEARVIAMDPAVAVVEARRLLQQAADHARSGNLPSPTIATGQPLQAAVLEWGSRVVEALAHADAPLLGWSGQQPVAIQNDWRARPMDGVRGIVSPLLAAATDLAMWAETRAAQDRLPELVRRLILATAPRLERIDMAAGEAVQQSGYDGIVVNAAPHPFIPMGRSVWEMGVSGDVKRKADGDFQKRSNNPLGLNPADTTFVFVTPHRWPAKRIWEQAHLQTGPWCDVRALDAEDLETWLGLAPSVHVWLSALLRKSWPAVQDLRSYWVDWCAATRPALGAAVVLAGREDAAADLRKRIESAADLVRVQGESTDEALACIAATMEGLENADVLLARTLVINDPAGWDWAVNANSPLLLLPRFPDPNAAQAIQHGHRVLIPVGREEGMPDDLVFPRLRRDTLKSALLSSGVGEEEADEFAVRGRASLISLRRSLAVNKKEPAWAHRGEAPALLPALLAGSWDAERLADQEVIAELAERPYQDVERSLARWADAPDPPVRRVGRIWTLVSKEDAWRLLSPRLTPPDLAQFRTVLLQALGIPDPAFELPPEDRWRANVLGYEHPVSAQLREGLTDTLAIMGARSGETTFQTGHTGQWHADRIVESLLDHADTGGRIHRWASLSNWLPLLAEAAPAPFLDAVSAALAQTPSPLLGLFADANQRAVVLATSPHTGLLWALETLAWSPDYLGLVACHLAALSQLDPGGALANRPISSLRSLFLIWDPQTAASLSIRLGALDQLRRHTPEIAWRLLLAIVPKPHEVSVPTREPRWRDWKDARAGRVTFEEYREAMEAITTCLLDDAAARGARWSEVLGILSNLPYERVVSALEGLPETSFPEEDRAIVWGALRSVISRHRSFADANWALPMAVVDRLERVYARLTPRDPVHRVAWLFAPRPDLVEGRQKEWSSYQKAIAEAQERAIRDLYDDHEGLTALLRLALVVEKPELVGWGTAIALPSLAENQQTALLGFLDAPEAAYRELVWGYVRRRFESNGWGWAGSVLEHHAPMWSPEKRSAFLRALPFVPETWDWAERFGEDTKRLYWLHVPLAWSNAPAAVARAAGLLLRYERPAHAVNLLGTRPQGATFSVDPELVTRALEQLARQGNAQEWGDLVHEIVTLLDYLMTHGTIAASRLAQLEWQFLPLLRAVDRPAIILGRELSQRPSFFIEVLCVAFRAHDEVPCETTDEQAARALLSYQLLDSWRLPPGSCDDGSIDEQAMSTWVDEARRRAAGEKRAQIADQVIGRVLSYVSDDVDNLWPHRAVRNLVERIASRDLETGLESGLYNSRGATWRGLHDGGAQERALQMRYLDYAQQLIRDWPRTAAMLRRIARTYAEEARWEDEQAEIAETRGR
jgi:hypothetical protein